MIRSRRTLTLLSIAAIVALGASSFLVFRQVSSSQRTTPVPKPDATALAQLTAIAQHYGTNTPGPEFSGEMNGFAFQNNLPRQFAGCSTDVRPADFASEHGSSLLNSSNLDFTATDIPSGSQPDVFKDNNGNAGHVIVGKCGDAITAVTENWTSSSGHFSVARLATGPVIEGHYSSDRLEATTINGRPAILVNPRFFGEQAYIYMRDDHSLWVVSSKELSVEALLQIAGGIE